MADRAPPEITLTTTTSAPVTQTTTSTYTIGGRRNRPIPSANTNTTTTDNNHRRPVTPNTPSNDVEPFPALPSPTPALEPTRSADYFSQPPVQYQVRTRPIGIKRLPSASNVEQSSSARPRSGSGLTRRRTNTGPGRQQQQQQDNATASLAALPGHYEIGAPGGMEPIVEGQEAHHGQNLNTGDGIEGRVGRSGSTRLRRASNAARSVLSKLSDDPEEDRDRLRRTGGNRHEYESDVVDYLDVLGTLCAAGELNLLLICCSDPEVSTLTTLTNVQNAMFVPDIPFLNRFINRRPTYELSRGPSRVTEVSEADSMPPQITRQISRQVSRKPVPPTPEPPEVPPKDGDYQRRLGDEGTGADYLTASDDLHRRLSITSHVEENHYAVLPHGVTLEGWSQEDVDALDDYVRHMLHSRRDKFKRSMKGFGKYIRKRKCARPTALLHPLTFNSSGIFRHSIRLFDYSFWSYMGSLLNWLDLCW